MKFSLSGVAAKTFGRSVQNLAKIGDEIVVSTAEGMLTLQSANAAKSAFGCVKFDSDFFLAASDVTSLTVVVNTACGILLPFRFSATFDKTVEICQLIFHPDYLLVEIGTKRGLSKMHRVDLIDGSSFTYSVDFDKYPNYIKGPARLFLDVVSQFHSKVSEVTLAVTAEKLTLRNYVDESNSTKAGSLVQSSVTFERREFDVFDVPQEAMDITFSLKTFKTILSYSESQQLDVNIRYDCPGAHVIVTLSSDNLTDVKILFVLATLDENTPDVVEEMVGDRRIRRELSIRPQKRATRDLDKVAARFDNDETLGRAKRYRVNEEPDDFEDLLDGNEQLQELLTQKENEARNRIQPEISTCESMNVTIDEAGPSLLNEDDRIPPTQEEQYVVTPMAKILLQNQIKAKRGLVTIQPVDDEIFAPASDED